jgi:ABC-2 type transport system ATP-binding protein
VIEVDQLVKRFATLTAVGGVTFQVQPGEIFGLLGPNGAGKTTTLSMVAGLLRPDSGRIVFDGVDLASDPLTYKARLGVVPQESAVYEELTARENLAFWAGLYGLSGAVRTQAVNRTLDRLGLAQRADEPVKAFSGGMRQRLNLGLGIVHGPRAVLLDEPTAGIDPQARMNILDLVAELAREGAAVLYTTHYLEEAEKLCDRIAILDSGRILAEGTLDELKRMTGEQELVTVRGSFTAPQVRDQILALPGVREVRAEDGFVAVSVPANGPATVELLSAVLRSGVPIDSVSIEPPSLNALFLHLTGRELRD